MGVSSPEPGVIVFRRPVTWVVFQAAFSPFLGAIVSMFLVPFTVIVAIVVSSRTGTPVLPTLAVAVGAAWAACTVPLTLLALRTILWTVTLDERSQTLATAGLVWFRPWWRPRVGRFVVPLAEVLHANELRGYRLYRRVALRYRIVTTRGIVHIPAELASSRELFSVLRRVASMTPPAPTAHTAAGVRTIGLLLGALLWVGMLAYVVFVFMPATVGR